MKGLAKVAKSMNLVDGIKLEGEISWEKLAVNIEERRVEKI